MDPVVSVCMSTFRQERFIAQAIEGVLMQETSFPVQLVIGEDCSPDGTRAICEAYAAKYGTRIHLLPSDRNYGQNYNLYRILKACTGKYIALCEGDDFWTDAGKLQWQVNFLERHAGYVLCFHAVNSVDENGLEVEPGPADSCSKFYNGLDLFHTFVPTPSMVFRNCIDEFPREFFEVKSTDAFLCGLLSGFGKAVDLGFTGASYRKHDGGLYNSLSLPGRYRQSIHTRKLMKRSAFFSKDQKQEIKRELRNRELLYLKSFLKKGQLLNCLRMAAFYITA